MINIHELPHDYVAANHYYPQCNGILECWCDCVRNWDCVCCIGCDSGFGHDLARFLDSAGMKVFAGVLDELSPGALKLKKAASPNLTVLQLDVTNSSQITQAHQYIRSQTGKAGKNRTAKCGVDIWSYW